VRLTTKIRDGAGDRASCPLSRGHAMLSTDIQMPGFIDVMQAMHWIIVVLLLGAYSAAWMIDTTISSANTAWLAMLHRCFEITTLLLVGVRLTLGLHTRVPPLPAGFSAAQRFAAQANAGLLYLLLILQTLLGLLESMLYGNRIVLFGAASLPVVQLVDQMFARQVL
jgi:cytochrome b561